MLLFLESIGIESASRTQSQFEGVESENVRKNMEIYPGDSFNLFNYPEIQHPKKMMAFKHGISRRKKLWVYIQPVSYI